MPFMKAPGFILENQNGKSVSSEHFKGRWVVLYFYPKDNTPGCTTEAVDFSNLIDEFKQLSAVVLGVSTDSIPSHCDFIKKHDLKINLLSDHARKVSTDYGVWTNKNLYGLKYIGIDRSTFLISPTGDIAHSWKGVSVYEHAKNVLEKLKELQK